MAEVTFVATVDESRVLQLPPESPVGEVEVVVREKYPRGSSAALWRAVREAPQSEDPTIWDRAREELLRSREEE